MDVFLSESNYMSQNATLSFDLKRAVIFKIPSEALLSVLICASARSSFLTWLRSQILKTLSLVLQNISLLALCPLIFFIVLSAESHITSIHLPRTLGDLCENALFIYLQFGISLIFLVCGSRFSFGWHSIPLYSDIFKLTLWSVINCLLVHIWVLLPCKIEVQKSIFLSFQICEIFLELIFKQLFIVVFTAATQDSLECSFSKVQKNLSVWVDLGNKPVMHILLPFFPINFF